MSSTMHMHGGIGESIKRKEDARFLRGQGRPRSRAQPRPIGIAIAAWHTEPRPRCLVDPVAPSATGRSHAAS